MHNQILPLFLLIFLTATSCKKETIVEPVQFDVVHTTWNDTLGYASNNNMLPPVAFDSVFIDINDDGLMDLHFKSIHASQVNSGVGVSSFKYLDVHSIDTNYLIAVHSDTNGNSNFLLGPNETIKDDFIWEKHINLFGEVYQVVTTTHTIHTLFNIFGSNDGDGFIAVRYQNNGDYYYGWITVRVVLGMEIFESAFNKVPNIPIRMGQTE